MRSRKAAAAEWALKRDRGLSLQEKLEYEQWRKKYSEGDELSKKYGDVLDKFDVLKIRDAEGLANPDPGLFAPTSEPVSWGSYMFRAAAVAAVLAVGYFVKPAFFSDSEPELMTLTQSLDSLENDYYELADGSTLELNGDTQVDYRYTAESRDFWVKSGEAYFTVAKDPERPFNVYVYGTRIQALGTQFNVRYQESFVEVMVTEGVVSLARRASAEAEIDYEVEPSASAISINQRTTIFPHGVESGIPISSVSIDELDAALAWKPVTLRFSETPLQEVIEAFNQYNQTQLILADDDLNDMLIDVTFRSNKLEGFVRLIEATHNVVANRQGDRIYLYQRH